MEKFFAGLKKAEEILLVVLMVIMCVIIFVATVARFTNLFVISWAEELVIAFNLVASYFGIMIVQKQMAGGQITPSLNWPMWIIYLAIPIGLVLMAVSYAYFTLKKVTAKDEEVEA